MNDEVNESYIINELKKFDITDHAISELSKTYMPLKIINLDDKEGYKAVKYARITMKNYRVAVEKRRKELTADALKFQRAINSEAKRISDLLIPIEDHLFSQEEYFDEELNKIKREKEQKEAARIQSRVNKLLEFGFVFDGNNYICNFDEGTHPVSISAIAIKIQPDDAFDKDLVLIKEMYDKKQTKLTNIARLKQEALAKEEEERKAESERLTQIHKEQEAERRKLDAIAKEQAEREALLKAEQARIDKEKHQHEERTRLEFEAAETQKRNAEEALKKENKKRLEEIAEQERYDLLMPDKTRLTNFCNELKNTISHMMPEVHSQEAKSTLVELDSQINQLLIEFENKIKYL